MEYYILTALLKILNFLHILQTLFFFEGFLKKKKKENTGMHLGLEFKNYRLLMNSFKIHLFSIYIISAK